ncbi:MAG: Flp pilus assembly protein CpaB [Acidimicrobiales bacterium]
MPVPSLPRPLPGTARLHLPRQPALFWLAAVVLAALTGLTVARLISQAQAEAARWGDLRPTLVATTDLEAGSIIDSGDVRVERRPATLVPAGALAGPAEGQAVSAPIHRGEAVLADRLAPAGLSATAAALPEGRFGIAVPTGVGALALEPGDMVDVLVTFDPDTVGDGEPTFPVARSTTVVGVTEEAVTLAVTEDEAPRVAFALTAGVVTLVLSAAR